jgi:superfamily II RNA helicase
MSFLNIPDLTTPPTVMPSEPAISYSFPLDHWQQHAVAAIHAGHNVFTTAKTGSGKTLVGEYAIAHHLKAGGRIFYTTPIKSLTNQKYHDLKKLFPDASVGIMTGDIKSAPEADIVVMTTEILRNLLFKQSTATAALGTAGQISMARVSAVVFDEVHYVNDPDRGHVWEETLILLPAAIQLVLLSATIDSAREFAAWLGDAKQRPITLLSTTHRIVPLVHGVWDPTVRPLPLRALKTGDEAPYDGRVYTDWLKGKEARLKAAEDWSARVKSAAAAGDSIAGATGKVKIHSFTHTLNMAVSELKARDLLPALFFVFSRKECERYAEQISGSLLDSSDTAAVRHVIRHHLHHYDAVLSHLPQYHQIVRLLERGIAFHHSGLLPLLKEIVELLFAKGYVRALFCTETFAVRLNMPARTVVFLDLKKPAGGPGGGGGFRPLRTDEYIQMAGRAGRRGKDTQGVVIYLPSRDPVEPEEMRGILSGGLVPLTSRLAFHYDFLIKALHVSKTASTPVWNTVIKNSYWAAQRAVAAAAAEKEAAALRTALAALEVSEADAAEMRTRDQLATEVRSSVNAAKRKAAAALNHWTERHMGPKWKALEAKWASVKKTQASLVAAESAVVELRTDRTEDKVAPVLAVLGDWGLMESGAAAAGATPALNTAGTLATEFNEGNPLLLGRLYTSGLLKDATATEIVSVLGAFIVDKEAQDKSTHPSYLDTTSLVKSTLLTVDGWAQEGLDIEAKYNVGSPEEFWNLTTLWVELGAEWLAGAEAAALATKYEIYEGNLMRGILKLTALLNEWISIATFMADVDILDRLKDVPAKLLRDIAVPESLYLRL